MTPAKNVTKKSLVIKAVRKSRCQKKNWHVVILLLQNGSSEITKYLMLDNNAITMHDEPQKNLSVSEVTELLFNAKLLYRPGERIVI